MKKACLPGNKSPSHAQTRQGKNDPTSIANKSILTGWQGREVCTDEYAAAGAKGGGREVNVKKECMFKINT